MASEYDYLSPVEIEERLCKDYKISINDDNSDPNSINSIVNSISYFCSTKDLIPVICEDMYEYEYVDQLTQKTKRQSLRSYMIHEVLSKIDTSGIVLSSKELKEIASGSYYGVQLLEEKLGNRTIHKELFESVIDMTNNKVQERICLKDEVAEFLQRGNFPLIITTNCFPILEEKVLSNYHYTSSWYPLKTKKEIDEEKEKSNENAIIRKLPKKCIYHIFGKANPIRVEWGYNDKQVLQYLKSACSDDYYMSELSTYVAANKALLFLGNDTPDWLFRFILTPIYGRNVYDTGTDYYITEKSDYDDDRLSHFLKDIHFEKESRLIEVLKKVNETLKTRIEATPSPDKHNGHNKKYDFFISHASQDNDLVRKIVKRLNDNGITQIWVDYEKIKDGTYWNRIIQGIHNSAYFLPIVTKNFLAKTKEKEKQTEAFTKANLSAMSFDATDVRNLNDYLDGVQVELLLAEEYFKRNYQDPYSTYSIPILQKGCTIYDIFSVDITELENLGKAQRVPENLFRGEEILVFDEDDPDSFNMDWNRYKSEKELNNE